MTVTDAEIRSASAQTALVLLLGAHVEGLTVFSRTIARDLPETLQAALIDHEQASMRLLKALEACDE